MISRFFYVMRQSFKQIVRNKAMSLASVFSITAMLLILGVFFILIINVNMATETIKHDYNNIEVFLLDETDKATADKLENEIKDYKNVKSTQYRSKEEAMGILKHRWGDSGYLLTSLKDNPLPNSIVVTVSNLGKAGDLVTKLKGLTGVEDVRYYKDTVDKLVKATDFMQIAAVIVMSFLIIVSIVVVSNTIKLTVFNRSEEISIMKYVGATNWFIRGPFLVEGIVIGGFSALLSGGIVALVYSKIVSVIGKGVLAVLSMPLVPMEFLTYNLIWIFLALGMSIGAWGSIISMRRFLDT